MYSHGTKLKMHFEGKLEDGNIFYSSHLQGNTPFEFTVGENEILPALEARIVQMNVGDRATFVIPAEEAYGVYDETLKERVPLIGIPNGMNLPVGGFVVFSTEQGPLRVRVESIEEGVVTFDYNHEFAGHDLTFSVDLLGALDWSSHIGHEKYYADAEEGCSCHSFADHDHDREHECSCGRHGA